MIKEKKIYAMNIVTELLVEDIAKETRRPMEEVLLKFMKIYTVIMILAFACVLKRMLP